MVMNEKDVNDRIKLFYNTKTYTHIQNVFERFYNGYIISIESNHIIFQDDELGNIPIIITEITKIDYSLKNKNPNK